MWVDMLILSRLLKQMVPRHLPEIKYDDDPRTIYVI